jgi:hypothetical protein
METLLLLILVVTGLIRAVRTPKKGFEFLIALTFSDIIERVLIFLYNITKLGITYLKTKLRL